MYFILSTPWININNLYKKNIIHSKNFVKKSDFCKEIKHRLLYLRVGIHYTALYIKKLEIIRKCKRLLVLKCCARYRVTTGIDQCGDQSSEQAKEHLDFKLIDTLNLVCHLSFSFQFWNSLCLEIMYQADTFRQTHRTTEANSLAQQAIKRLFYFYLPKIQFTCFGQSNLGFSYPVNAVLISPLVQVL